MLNTRRRAVNLYYNEKGTWCELVKGAMWEDNGWQKSANKYIELYSSIL
jgi:starch synthase